MKIKYLFSKVIKKIQIPAIKDSNIDQTAKVGSNSHIVKTSVGRFSYVGNSCTVLNTEIKNFCSIADNCIIGGASHPMNRVSSSPVFHQGKNILKKNFSTHNFIPYKNTIIGNDVWIGNNCLIKSGVKIENGAVIGMGSIVTKDVGPYEIWAGNPARIIRKRFSDEEITKLQSSEWWNWDDKSLSSRSSTFNDIEKFLDEIGE